MHNTIICLGEDKDNFDSFNEFGLNEDLHHVTDYVDEITDEETKKSEIQYFVNYLNKFSSRTIAVYDKVEGCIVFSENAIEDLLREKYDEFRNEVTKMSFKEFCGGGGGIKLYHVEELLEDKFGYIIALNDERYTVSLDRFIREDLTPGVKYFVSDVFDYLIKI